MLTAIFIAILFQLPLSGSAYLGNAHNAQEIRWISIEEAMNQCAQNPKPIMIDFYTDWCGWCKKLDQTTYADQEVICYINAHFYAVKFDAEQKQDIQFLGKTYSFIPSGSRGTHQFASQMANRNGRLGYPTITFLDANGSRISAEGGYKDPAKMKNVMKYYAEGFYKEMNFNDFLTKQAEQISAD
jgi:thioredoxin-related protein